MRERDICETAELFGLGHRELTTEEVVGTDAPEVAQCLGTFGKRKAVALILWWQDFEEVVEGFLVDCAGDSRLGGTCDEVWPGFIRWPRYNWCAAKFVEEAQQMRGRHDCSL